MEKLIQDLRFAFRSILRQPAFAITAIVTLALGIGATTAIFSVVNGVLLRSLPFPQPERIVGIVNLWTKTGVRAQTVSAPDFHDWKAQSQSFQTIAYFTGGQTRNTPPKHALNVACGSVTPRSVPATFAV